MTALFSSPKMPAAPPPPPPPPAPPTMASQNVTGVGAAQQQLAAAAAGQGYSGTLLTSNQGALTPQTAGKTALGQ